ncbi:hypothetical protein [Streptomyces griseoluteus]|uniref:hypothetical protein n=1 Tax=Streptomyces griseoluteus TaxID=29306 RepID=UPI0036A8BD15
MRLGEVALPSRGNQLMNTLVRTAVGLGAAVAVTALAAGPASAAANDRTIYSTSISVLGVVTHHASLHFIANGDKWTVCDSSPEGDRAMGSVYWEDSGGNHQIITSVTTGVDTCKSGHYDLPESATVYLRVWHQNGANGVEKDVERSTTKAGN